MVKSIYQLVGEIMALAAIITENTKADVFVEYQAHCNELRIKYYLNGWKVHADADISSDFYIAGELAREPQKKLEAVKRTLIQIGIKGKIDFSELPYEIEEVKHYKFVEGDR